MADFKGKTILITGGTGSFGGYFANYLLNKDFKEIRIFSRDELKQEQMRQRLNHSKIKFYIGDIRDRGSVDDALHVLRREKGVAGVLLVGVGQMCCL